MLIPMLQTMTLLEDNMKKAASRGFINATDMADYLTRKGMPFRDAYKLTGSLVAKALEKGCGLDELSLEELQAASPLFEDDIEESLDLLTCVSQRKTKGGPAPEQVVQQIASIRSFLQDFSTKENQA